MWYCEQVVGLNFQGTGLLKLSVEVKCVVSCSRVRLFVGQSVGPQTVNPLLSVSVSDCSGCFLLSIASCVVCLIVLRIVSAKLVISLKSHSSLQITI